MVFVLDPVAHTMLTWSTDSKATWVATLIKLPEGKHDAAKAAPAQLRPEADSRPQPVVTTESLGKEMLQGLPVTVTKTMTVVPVGRSGNDAPITKTHEVWTSPDLKLVMKEQWEDPRTASRQWSLISFRALSQTGPCFRLPRYEVKDIRQTLKELEEKLGQMAN